MSGAVIMLIGFGVDAILGWPDRLYARVGHPVTWIGRLITLCEQRWNTGRDQRRLILGTITVLIVCTAVGAPTLALQIALQGSTAGLVVLGLCAAPLIATRSMFDHLVAVARPLAQGDLEAARNAVSMIVGRDPKQLDAAGITRAGLESLAENTSDGIVAPVLWGLVAGLPGIAIYKAINTMDSMIGHRSDRYEWFGKTAARLDDVVNWIPARVTGAMFAIGSGASWRRAWHVIRVDARHHRSPNAGWPEGAMAGALNVRLSGPRAYENHVVQEPWINAKAPDPTASDLQKGVRLYIRSMALLALALAALTLF